MFKFLIIGIVLIGTAFGVPAIRNRIAGPLDPLLSRLGPVGDKVQAPARRWAARNEANIIIRKIAEVHNQGKEVPTPLRFQVWMKQNFRGGINEGRDPWDKPYYLIQTGNQITVGSQGPDRTQNTPDDVRVSVPLSN